MARPDSVGGALEWQSDTIVNSFRDEYGQDALAYVVATVPPPNVMVDWEDSPYVLVMFRTPVGAGVGGSQTSS